MQIERDTMKIGYDAKRAFHNFTGLGNYSRFILHSLSENFPDNQYFLYTPKPNSHPEVLETAGNSNQIIRTPTGIWKLGFLKSLWRSVFLGTVFAKDNLDIFHGLSNELPAIKIKSCRYVLTVHDLLFIRLPHLYRPVDVRIYTAKLRKSCHLADRIIAISEQTREDLIRFLQVDPKKIKVVYQGAHPQFYHKTQNNQKEVIRKKYDLPQNFLLSVGTIEKRKNAGLILQAMAKSPDRFPVLVLVGKPTSYLEELQDLIRSNNLHGKVRFLHRVSFVDLPAIYQMARLMIYPSLFEGFGIPIIEAQLSGVPVITSTGSCFAEAGGKGALYGSPDDPLQLFDHIQKVLEDTALSSRLIEEGYKNVLRFIPEKIAKDTMAVYQSVFP